VLDGKILLLRPKMYLANDGNYRETRYFATWKVCFPLSQPSTFLLWVHW
jgi:hypothetical protein